MYEHYYRLENKVSVYLAPQKDAPSMTVLVVYPVGSRYESDRLAGASHFIEHMMFKGTKRRPNTLVLTREIDRLGAQYNAFTGKEYTGYYVKVDADYVKTAIDILSDMVFNSRFEAREMEKEKMVIVEEIRMYKDNPFINIENVFENLMYQGCPLGREVAGSEQSVLGLKRSDLLDYRDKYYKPANMTIVAAGKITDKTKRHLERYFGLRNGSQKASSRVFSKSPFGPLRKEKRISVQKKPTDQVQLMVGFPGFHYNHRQNTAVSVLSTILGGSMSSRLFIEIRERRGLAYMVRSGAEKFKDTGHFFVRAGLDSKNINEAIRVIKREMERIIAKGVTARELKDAKTNIRGSLILSLEDSETQANWYAAEALFMDEVKTPAERLKEVDGVTNSQIREAAAKLFKMDEMRVAVIGDVDADNVLF